MVFKIIDMRLLYVFALLCCVCNVCFAQTATLTLQPDAAAGKDARIWSIDPTANDGTDPEFIAAHWTFSGTPGTYRSLLEFDLSSIPVAATVVDAKLSLYYNATSGSAGQSGANEAVLQRVIQPWDESTVTWSNQPSTTATNQVVLSESTSPNQNYTNTDVTALVQDMVNDPANSHGFMLKLQAEVGLASMKFCSSDCTTDEDRPSLVVTYISNDSIHCFVQQPDPTEGIDAYVWSINSSTNYGSVDDYIAAAWTWSGEAGTLRSLMKFDLSSIPVGAFVTEATLSLYYNPTSTTNGQEGSNDAYLQRITTPWNENTVTWDNQPAATNADQVTLPASTSISQDYPDIDVTGLVQAMVYDPANSYGFMFRLANEQEYRSMKFASSDYTDPSLRPKLEVCYQLVSGIYARPSQNNLSVYPNPTNGLVYLNLPPSTTTVKLMNELGQTLHVFSASNVKSGIDLNGYPQGMYFIEVTTSESRDVCKVMLTR